MISTRNIIIDPYHPQLGALAHMVAMRLARDAKRLGDEEDFSVYNVLSRLCAKDPTILMIASLDAIGGNLVGYCVASIENTQVFVLQPHFDEPVDGDATGEVLSIVENWAKRYNESAGVELITRLTLVVRRYDPKWAKKYNFETRRYLLERKLGE